MSFLYPSIYLNICFLNIITLNMKFISSNNMNITVGFILYKYFNIMSIYLIYY